MATNLSDLSDEELHQALASGELADRKALIAEELLRRRNEARAEQLRQRYKFVGGVLATLMLAFVGLKKLWRK
jgi:hypothetical protein